MGTGLIASPALPVSEPTGAFPGPFVNGDVLYEVVNHEVRELPPMSARETHFASLLFGILFQYARSRGLGQAESEMLFMLDSEKGLQRRPDLSFVSFARWPRGKPVPGTRAWEVVPNLAVEVISPTNGANEIIEKIDDYFASGVQRVWVFYPLHAKCYDYESATSVRILTGTDTLEGGELLPGFQLPLVELFEGPAGGA